MRLKNILIKPFAYTIVIYIVFSFRLGMGAIVAIAPFLFSLHFTMEGLLCFAKQQVIFARSQGYDLQSLIDAVIIKLEITEHSQPFFVSFKINLC